MLCILEETYLNLKRLPRKQKLNLKSTMIKLRDAISDISRTDRQGVEENFEEMIENGE